MTPRDFLGPDDRVVEKAKPYCVTFEFMAPPDTDRIPARAIGSIVKRCYRYDVPQIGWDIGHLGHWWKVVAIRQMSATKNSRDQDRLPVRVCKYLEPIRSLNVLPD